MDPVLMIMAIVVTLGALIAFGLRWPLAWRLWLAPLLIIGGGVYWDAQSGPRGVWDELGYVIIAAWGMAYSAPFILRGGVVAARWFNRRFIPWIAAPETPRPPASQLERRLQGLLDILLLLSGGIAAALAVLSLPY